MNRNRNSTHSSLFLSSSVPTFPGLACSQNPSSQKFCCKPTTTDQVEALFEVTDFVFPPPPFEEDLSQYYVAVQGLNGMAVTYSITNIWSIGYTATIEVNTSSQAFFFLSGL